jgi:hypothetical protein
LVTACLLPRIASAAILNEINLRGKIVSFDRNSASLQDESGKVLIVPRSLLPKTFRAGDTIDLTLTEEEFKKVTLKIK